MTQETLERTQTGAGALVSTLYEHGTRDIFLIPGAANLPICRELYDFQKIKYFIFRHEQGMAFAAAGYARAKGKPGVFLATSGPGVLNTVTAIANAKWDSTPLVGICGQAPTFKLGTEAFQETDIVDITKSITKHSYQVKDPSEIPFVIDEAFIIASHGRPGPVLIDIPVDLQSLLISPSAPRISQELGETELDPEVLVKLEQAARMIEEAENVLIIAGQGVEISETETHLQKLAEKIQSPVASTLLGLSILPSDHPLSVGMIGTHGTMAANILADQAHVIIALGAKLDERATGGIVNFGKQTRVIHIDIDKEQLNRRVPTELAIHADLKSALPILIELVKEKPKESDIFWSTKKADIRKILSTDSKLTPDDAMNLLFEKTSAEDIIVSDAGQHQMLVAKHARLRLPRRFLTTGGQGAMGYGLAAAIGAQIACPERKVILITGDGGLQMNIQEFGTIMHYGIPVRTVVWNDFGYNMVRKLDIDSSFTDFKNPDFVKLAHSYEIAGVAADNYRDLDNAYNQLLSSEEACIVDLKLPVEEPTGNVYYINPN